MSESYSVSQYEQEGIVVLQISGYFGELAGQNLTARVDELLCHQKGKMVFDLSQCEVLASPGIGSLLEIVDKVVEEFNGSMAFIVLDPVMVKVLNLTHVTALAGVAQTLSEAIEYLKQDI